MFRAVLWIVRPVLLLLLAGACQADVVTGLYTAEVQVSDHSSAARSQASRGGLAQVLVKVSGSVTVLDNPVVSAALGQANTYLRQYSYTLDEGAAGDLAVRLEFDDTLVSGLLNDAAAPLWTANRPSVLTWLVFEDERGRQFLSPEWAPAAAPDLLAQIRAEFDTRGVPVQVPLFDLVDAAQLSAGQVWSFDVLGLEQASLRYGAEHILAGRVVVLSSGVWLGEWNYLAGRERVERSVRANDGQEFLRSGVAIVAEAMAARYAVAPSSDGSQGVRVVVNGVYNYADYAGIVSWLEGLEVVDHANVEHIRGDQLQLQLTADASTAQLATLIELNEKLIPQMPIAGDSGLSYLWRN